MNKILSHFVIGEGMYDLWIPSTPAVINNTGIDIQYPSNDSVYSQYWLPGGALLVKTIIDQIVKESYLPSDPRSKIETFSIPFISNPKLFERIRFYNKQDNSILQRVNYNATKEEQNQEYRFLSESLIKAISYESFETDQLDFILTISDYNKGLINQLFSEASASSMDKLLDKATYIIIDSKACHKDFQITDYLAKYFPKQFLYKTIFRANDRNQCVQNSFYYTFSALQKQNKKLPDAHAIFNQNIVTVQEDVPCLYIKGIKYKYKGTVSPSYNTIGAGDMFVAALASALSHGEELETAAKLAFLFCQKNPQTPRFPEYLNYTGMNFLSLKELIQNEVVMSR